MTAATLSDIGPFDGRALTLGEGARWLRGLVFLLSGVATAGALVATATVAAGWIFAAAISTNTQVRASLAPAATAMAPRVGTPATTDFSLEAKVARARALAIELARLAPPPPVRPVEVAEGSPPRTEPVPLPQARPQMPAAPAVPPTVMYTASLPPAAPQPSIQVESVPLPQPAPARPQAAPAGETRSTQVASLTPTAPAPAQPKPAAPPVVVKSPLPDRDSRTAVYDISAGTVYMPNGDKLEAHSGLGEKMDDPRSAPVRMRGVTPPNVYTLALREQLFHGVRAIRLNPVDEGKMHGRDGILAHTYMLGPSGQSNGCVSFRDYDKFLHAYLNGQIERMVVVSHLDGMPPSRFVRRRRGADRYASAELFDRARGEAW